MNDLTILSFFLQGAALGLTATASPGPLQTFLISESLRGGWRRGIPVAFAPLASDLPIVLMSLFLLNQLPPMFLRFLSLAGGLFALYLAWGLWLSWRAGTGQPSAPAEAATAPMTLARAALINFLSPSPYLFWALVNGPLLVSALRQSVGHGAGFLLGFYGIFVGAMAVLVGLFHLARRLGPAIVRLMLLVSMLILAFFGFLLIIRGLRG
jgi:threonine/homoserine/homoserine lactone efflux protein